MSENSTTSSDATTQDSQPTSGPRHRVHGSIRLHVTVTATNPDEATQAAPGAVTDAFAGLPGAVIPPEWLAIGIPKPLGGEGSEPSRYQVPITLHGYLDIAGDDDTDLPYAALNAVAEHLDGRDNVDADLDSAVCDQVTEIPATQPTE